MSSMHLDLEMDRDKQRSEQAEKVNQDKTRVVQITKKLTGNTSLNI